MRRRRVKTPTVLQMEAVECGAASLSMILAHHGRFVPLAELREACGVTRDGSTAKNVLCAARRFGLEARGMKRSVDTLVTGPLPVIIHWNFDHFVVLEGVDDRQAYLNDPACGRRAVSREQLDRSFTGVVLELSPGPDFVRGGTPPSVWRGIQARARGLLTPWAFLVIASLALIVPGVVLPTAMRVFVDDILIGGHRHWLGALLVGLTLTALVRGALVWLRSSTLVKLYTKLAVTGAARFLWHTLRLPIPFFLARHAGDIGARVDTNDDVARLLAHDATQFGLDACLVVLYAALLFVYDAPLAFVCVTVSGLQLFVVRWLSARRTEENQRLQQARGKIAATTAGGLLLIETLKAGGTESDFFARWAGQWAKLQTSAQSLGRATMLMHATPAALSGWSTAAILTLGGLRVIDGELTIGALVAFQTLMASFLEPAERLVGHAASLQDAEADLARLDDVLEHERAETDDVAPAAEYQRLSGHVRMSGLSFGYSRLDAPLIEDFELTLTPGQRVALVGGSGSGKSTIARLLANLYRPWAGEILFDGFARDRIAAAILEDSIAVVDQDVVLFEGTIRDNLTLWDPTVPDRDLVRAARDAEIHDDIAAHPGGYDARVEELGRNFSGGQRQRMEIARALVKNPSILLLDEATSALDPRTEKRIDDNLRRRGCTCLIVAHRLSTIRDCDEILVLDRGRVLERGTHDHLIGSGGMYADLMANG